MYDLVPIEIAASGMRAERVRMGVVAANLANARSTRRPDGPGPYQRQQVVFQAGNLPAFEAMLAASGAPGSQSAAGTPDSRWLLEEHLRGVDVPRIEADPSVRREFDASGTHPDRDAEGYVNYPDIQVVTEMTDMISSSRNYEANLAVVKNTRDMVTQLLEMLRT